MKALVYYGVKNLKVEQVPNPILSKDHVLIKVKYVGICGTDIAIYRGDLKPSKIPIILGHEISGIVEDVGVNVDKNLINKNVVVEINIVDNTCEYCRKGLYTHCLNRKAIGIDIDGGMAEYISIPQQNVHILPSEIPLREAIFIEPLAAILRMFELIPFKPHHKVIVLGQGPIAYLTTSLLKDKVSKIVVIGTKWYRLKFFENIVDHTLNLNEVKDIKNEVQKVLNDIGADIVIEVTNNPNALELALNLVKPMGIIAAKSTHGKLTQFNYTKMVVNEVSIISSRCGPYYLWKEAINILKNRKIDLNKIITHEFNLDEGLKAFEIAESKNCMKVILKI